MTTLNSLHLQDIARNYGIRIRDCEQKGRILFLATNRGEFALKPSKLEPNELDLEYNVCQHLISNGFNRIAPIVSSESGRGFSQIGSQRFILTKWLDGVEADFLNPQQLELATRNLAQFHIGSRGYRGRVYWQKRKLYGVWPQRFRYRLAHIHWYRKCINSRGVQDEFDSLFVANADLAIAQAEAAIARLQSSDYYLISERARKMGTVCHHDYAHHNLLIKPDGTAWLIDFDYCVLDSPLHDLGSLILRTFKLTNWSLPTALRILLVYHEEKAIDHAELEVLLGFLEYPQDFWQLAWAKYNEVGMHKPDILLARFKKLLEGEANRRKFLTEFAELI